VLNALFPKVVGMLGQKENNVRRPKPILKYTLKKSIDISIVVQRRLNAEMRLHIYLVDGRVFFVVGKSVASYLLKLLIFPLKNH